LSLSDDIASLDAWNDGSLLDSRGFLETVSIDTAEKFLLQVHGVKVIDDFIPVGFDDATDFHASWSVITLRLTTIIFPKIEQTEMVSKIAAISCSRDKVLPCWISLNES
jgi:hypothetical protein